MSTTTIRIDQRTHAVLAELAREQQTTITAVIDQAGTISKIVSGGSAPGSRGPQEDPMAWAEYQTEVRSMDATLMDGLEDEPPWQQ